MTTAEAIKVIKDMIEIEWRRQFPPDLATDYIEALELAVEALRKQEPVNSCWYCRGIQDHKIVSVKTVVDEFGRELPAYDTPYNYCPNCGQKIDWTEDEA